MKDKSNISPEKEKPLNVKEMLMETENIDIRPNVLPSTTKTNIEQAKPPTKYSNT